MTPQILLCSDTFPLCGILSSNNKLINFWWIINAMCILFIALWPQLNLIWITALFDLSKQSMQKWNHLTSYHVLVHSMEMETIALSTIITNCWFWWQLELMNTVNYNHLLFWSCRNNFYIFITIHHIHNVIHYVRHSQMKRSTIYKMNYLNAQVPRDHGGMRNLNTAGI